jgi:membrane-bound ClpP family serine protease
VNNNTLDVVTEGEYIEKGQIIEIIEIRGNRIVVKAI